MFRPAILPTSARGTGGGRGRRYGWARAHVGRGAVLTGSDVGAALSLEELIPHLTDPAHAPRSVKRVSPRNVRAARFEYAR